MSFEWLGRIPLWAIFALTVVIALLATEIGFRLARRDSSKKEGRREHEGVIVGSMLALLSFLLAFTFGMASSRFDARRATVLEEANAIGTAYLRASLLPDPYDRESRERLLEYVDLRIAKDPTPEMLRHALQRSSELQQELFQRAVAVAKADPHATTASLFVQAMNDVIDVDEKRRMAGLYAHTPEALWVALWLLVFVATMSIGVDAGFSGTRPTWRFGLLVLSFAMVITLIADLDRPMEGWINTSQRALVDAQESMRANP